MCGFNQCVDSANFEKIALATSVKEAWDILNKSYGDADKIKKVKLQSLRRQYELLSMNDQELVLVNSTKACGEKIQNFENFDPQFDHIVVAIEESKDLQRMRVKELQNSLEAHEQRLLERISMRVAAQALQAQDFRRNNGGGSKNKKGKWKNKLRDSSEGQKIPNQNSGSNNYKKNGDQGKFSKKGDECYSNKRKQKKEDEAQMAQGDSDDSDSNHVLLMVTTSDCAKSDFWYLDTGVQTT
ncbi:hypothetical protein CR513_30502, partial [Mucuna pruriens]